MKAVNGISYSLRKGEALGIVGESGCGKSVSVKSVIRLLPPKSVRISADYIRFFERDILDLSTRELRKILGNKISMVFQDPMNSLNPVLTIGRQIIEPLIIHTDISKDKAKKKAVELLELVKMPDAVKILECYPHELSGGMQQRIMIAMALICSPELLIADEPTTALDVTIQAQIIDLIKDLRNSLDMALIWISHDLGVVAGLVDRVIVMYAGCIVEETLVDDLFYHPKHPYTKALLKSLPCVEGRIDKKLETISGYPPDLIQLPKGCCFAERCKYNSKLCIEKRPELIQVSDTHKVACWEYVKGVKQ